MSFPNAIYKLTWQFCQPPLRVLTLCFSTYCFPTSCPWLSTFAHPYFTYKRDIFKFLLWFVTHKALLGSRQYHCPSTSLSILPPRVWAGDRLQQSSHIFHKRRSPCRARDMEVCGVGTASFAIFILTFFFSSKGSYSMHILQRLESSLLTSFSLYQTHTHTHTCCRTTHLTHAKARSLTVAKVNYTQAELNLNILCIENKHTIFGT